MPEPQNYINHIVLVLDASISMTKHKDTLVKVADAQIAYLAQRSKDLDQETRITVYTFSDRDEEECLVYDKDVLRMPSIADLYRIRGNTALLDATLLAISDLKMTPEKYGEHAFLIYVLTDGQENDSRARAYDLKAELVKLPDNWTLAAFVPNSNGIFEAKRYGFQPNNIEVWDTTTAQGVKEVGERIRATSEQFMQNRKAGIRGTSSLFQLNTVTTTDLRKALTPLQFGSYRLIDVPKDARIDDTVCTALNRPYVLGEGFYQLTKRETVQPRKKIAILTKDHKLYYGAEARHLLGLPDHEVRVSPTYADYTVFVQSTSMNRKLIAGTRLLILPETVTSARFL